MQNKINGNSNNKKKIISGIMLKNKDTERVEAENISSFTVKTSSKIYSNLLYLKKKRSS